VLAALAWLPAMVRSVLPFPGFHPLDCFCFFDAGEKRCDLPSGVPGASCPHRKPSSAIDPGCPTGEQRPILLCAIGQNRSVNAIEIRRTSAASRESWRGAADRLRSRQVTRDARLVRYLSAAAMSDQISSSASENPSCRIARGLRRSLLALLRQVPCPALKRGGLGIFPPLFFSIIAAVRLARLPRPLARSLCSAGRGRRS